MLYKLRQRAQDEKGFTLIELLVVILIIGILAAIALPAFLGQRQKAQDAEAKSQARSAQTAFETIYTDKQKYEAGDELAAIKKIEPTIGSGGVTVTAQADSDNSYTIVATSTKTTHAFTLKKVTNADGSETLTRTCVSPGDGGCPGDGNW